jgi:serine/threonine protein kinase
MARGGYATVYRAMQESVGREVAVKVENRTLESDRDQRRFLREARAAGRMSSHPHVVDLFDAGVTLVGHPYLIMELCDGSYAERMKNAPLSQVDVRDVGIKIADALADAHSLGVLHRDVKPANILYTRFGEPALADFGLAILAETRDVSITLDVLTPAYAPPEMFRHASPAPAADVYGLCATLYALLRGKPPRWPDDGNPSLVSLVDMFQEPVPDLPGLQPELMWLLRAGMDNDEHSRPTAVEFRDALQALELGSSVSGPGLGAPLLPPLGSPRVYQSSSRLSTVDDDTVAHGIPAQPADASTSGASSGGSLPPELRPAVESRPERPSPQRGLWWAMSAGAVVLVVAIALLTVYIPDRGGTVGPSRSTSSQGQILATSCGLLVNPDVKCPDAPECYDGISTSGQALNAVKRDCNERHTWEVFALGELPADTPSTGVRTAAERVCNFTTLTTLGGFDKATWRIEVLGPTADELRAGNRTYRCLGGNPGKQFTSPQMTW